MNLQESDGAELSDIDSADSPPTKNLKRAAGKVLKSFKVEGVKPDGTPVEVEVEFRRGAPQSPGVPPEIFDELLRAVGEGAAATAGWGKCMAECMASRAVSEANQPVSSQDSSDKTESECMDEDGQEAVRMDAPSRVQIHAISMAFGRKPAWCLLVSFGVFW